MLRPRVYMTLNPSVRVSDIPLHNKPLQVSSDLDKNVMHSMHTQPSSEPCSLNYPRRSYKNSQLVEVFPTDRKKWEE